MVGFQHFCVFKPKENGIQIEHMFQMVETRNHQVTRNSYHMSKGNLAQQNPQFDTCEKIFEKPIESHNWIVRRRLTAGTCPHGGWMVQIIFIPFQLWWICR